MENAAFKRHILRKSIVAGVYILFTVAICVGVGIANYYLKKFEGSITQTLCYTEGSKSSAKSASKYGQKLAVEIEQEGIVLAKNNPNDGEEKPVLPLSKGVKKVNVFGHHTVDWMYSNSGSGSAGPSSGQTWYNLTDALTRYGIEYNTEVIDFYKSWVAPRSLPFSIQSNQAELYRLAEPSLANTSGYKAVYDNAKDYSDTAIVVIGRTGGEHIDTPHHQPANVNASGSGTHANNNRGYLVITEEEEELLKTVGKDFENVIVILNCTNVIECNFLKDEENFPGLDSVLIVGCTGQYGTFAIPQVIWGEVNPSGRTADTYPMKHEYNIVHYTNGEDYAPYYSDAPSNCNERNGRASATKCNFAPYIEGIYVGYKWFETADEEGYWTNMGLTYDDVVAFPFGHGLSYTTFDWEIVDSVPANNSQIKYEDDVVVNVKVTNTGDVAGRDVVELYLTAPYKYGEIEKSSVKLVGFAKTPDIAPGGSVVVQVECHGYDFASYDCYDENGNGHTGYEMDDGDYVLTCMMNSHVKKEMAGGNTVTYQVSKIINCDYDTVTNTKVRNLFTDDEAVDGISVDGKSIGQELPIDYIKRDNLPELLTDVYPNISWNSELEVAKDNSSHPTTYDQTKAAEWDNATGYDVFGNEIPTDEPTWGNEQGLKVFANGLITDLGRKLAADYNDPEWDGVLDQCTFDESFKIANNSTSYFRPGVKSCGLKNGDTKDFVDVEAASQVGVAQGSSRPKLTGYPTPTVQAQCWNTAMPYQFGKSEAKDMAALDDDASYGPASNIHRSPYGGRHSEYHSEDPILAGRTLAAVTKGLSDGGKQGFIKHFCGNDTEYHRVGLYTWMTEQALREVYMRPFEEAVKRGEATALMTSFNRVGATWSGGSEAMIQGVLRNEWGFKGMIITDMIENSDLMDISQAFRAGGNYVLGGNYQTGSATSNPTVETSTARLQHRFRDNLHQVIYAHIRVLYLNEQYNLNPTSGEIIVVTPTKAAWVWWKPTVNALETVIFVSVFAGLFAVLWPNNAEFRAELIARMGKKKNKELKE